MSKKLSILVICFLLLLTLLAIACLLRQSVSSPTVYISFPYTRNTQPHPLKGYAPFAQNFTSAQFFSSSIFEDITLFYAGLPWSQIEPQEGIFDFAGLDQKYNLDRLKQAGKRIVLRIIADQPSSEGEMAIPQWLFEAMEKQGTFYDTGSYRGFSPNYDHPRMISAHKRMLEAFNSHYGPEFIGYIQLGTVGQYGEWHTSYGGSMPSQESMAAYVQQYREVFPGTPLLFRRPFQASLDGRSGFYNDMLGTKESTDLWLSWLLEGDSHTGSHPIPEFWRQGPVGGEFSFGDPYSPLDDEHYLETLRQIRASHMSFIGPCMPMKPENEEQLRNALEVSQLLGYDLFLEGAGYPVVFTDGENKLNLRLRNQGMSPLFMNLELICRLTGPDGTPAAESTCSLDLSKVNEGDSEMYSVSLPVRNALENRDYTLSLLFRDPWTGKTFPLSNAAEADGEIRIASVRYAPEYSVYNFLKDEILKFFSR